MDWNQRLAELAAEAAVPGVVLGIRADGEETVAPYGVLSTATGEETTADSVFQVGSITKLWTATMIMQLAGEGRLTLDSTVAELLPGVRLGRRDASDQVTVRHLLTHTGGIDGDASPTRAVATTATNGTSSCWPTPATHSRPERRTPTATAGSYCSAGSSRCSTAGPGRSRCAPGWSSRSGWSGR